MKGLILKDIYAAGAYKKTLAIFIVIGIAYSFFMKDGGNYLSIMLGIICMMAVYNSFTYDEYYHWDRYAAALPVKRSSIVGAKYILIVFALALCSVFTVVISTVNFIITKNFNTFLSMLMSGLGIVLSYAFGMLLSVPLIYKFGIDKMRIASAIIMVVPMGIFIWFAVLLDDVIANDNMKFFLLIGSMALATLIALLASFKVSVSIVNKKEF